MTFTASNMMTNNTNSTSNVTRSAKTTSRQEIPFTGNLLLLAKKSRLKMQGIDLSKLYKQYSQATPSTKATIWYDFTNCERNIQIARAISQYTGANQQPVKGLLISQENANSPWVIGAVVELQSLKYPHMTFTVEKVFQCNVPAKGYLSSAQFKFGPIDRNGNLVEEAISFLDDKTYLTMVRIASQGTASQGTASQGNTQGNTKTTA